MKKIILKGREINYVFKKSRRVKNVRLSIAEDKKVTLTVPFFVGLKMGELFLKQKADWIIQKVDKISKKETVIPRRNRKTYLKNKEVVRKLVKERLVYFNSFYNFNFKNIFIRNQKTCWGSCSEKRNLNFNYRIIYLPEELCDYIIVHELCHLGQLNHSKKFWELVEKTIPDYRERKKKIRDL